MIFPLVPLIFLWGFAPRARRFMHAHVHADNAPLIRTCNARVCYGVVQNGTGCNNLFQETCINVGGETRCTLRYNPELGSMPAEFCTFESLNHVYTGSKIIPPSASHRVPDRPSAGRGTPHGLVYYFPCSYIARFPAFLALYMYLFYFIFVSAREEPHDLP